MDNYQIDILRTSRVHHPPDVTLGPLDVFGTFLQKSKTKHTVATFSKFDSKRVVAYLVIFRRRH